jgi:hypothetical protein
MNVKYALYNKNHHIEVLSYFEILDQFFLTIYSCIDSKPIQSRN